MRSLFFVAACLLCGCGSSSQQFTVDGHTMTVLDQGYFTTSGVDYCMAGAPGQMLIDFVDYNYICDPHHQPQRDPAVQHYELQIVLSMNNPQRDPFMPYQVGPADCTNGPTMEAIVRFLHYPANAKSPDTTTQADSGTVTITKPLPVNKAQNPLLGNFDAVFGGTHLKSTFSIYACN
jgi:hypothetical protein